MIVEGNGSAKAAGDIAVKVSNVDKYYGDQHVLKNVSFEVGDGQVLVIIGPSGSGKSTLLRAINGLEDIQGGEVRINGELFNAEKKPSLPGRKRAEVGMVFQHFNLYPHMNVLENVTLAPRKVRKKSKRQAVEIAMPLLEKVGMQDMVDKYPSQLSGGERQRVAIARSLVMQPKVMLFDEPTSALDVELINEVLETMVQLSREGMTMVVVTHELHFARRVATSVMFMDAGEVIETGDAETVIEHPEKERTRAFMEKIYQEG